MGWIDIEDSEPPNMCDLTFQWVGVGENLQETLVLHGLAIQISGFAVQFPNQSIDIMFGGEIPESSWFLCWIPGNLYDFPLKIH
jgi:hypothetical protein